MSLFNNRTLTCVGELNQWIAGLKEIKKIKTNKKDKQNGENKKAEQGGEKWRRKLMKTGDVNVIKINQNADKQQKISDSDGIDGKEEKKMEEQGSRNILTKHTEGSS